MAFSAVIQKLIFSNVNATKESEIRSTTVNGFYVRLKFLLSLLCGRRRYVCFFVSSARFLSFVVQKPVCWMQLRPICSCRTLTVRKMKSRLKSAASYMTDGEWRWWSETVTLSPIPETHPFPPI